MKAFASLPLSEQAFYFQQTAAKSGLSAEAVEKRRSCTMRPTGRNPPRCRGGTRGITTICI